MGVFGIATAAEKAEAAKNQRNAYEAAVQPGDPNDPHQSTYRHKRMDGSYVTAKESSQLGGTVPALFDPNSDASKGFSWRGDPEAARREHVQDITRSIQAQARQAPVVNTAQADAARGMQMGLASRYQQAIAGQGPSLAGYGYGQAAGRANQAAAAQAAQGGAAGARASMLGLGQAVGQAGLQSAGTRLQETGQYRDAYGKTLGGIRGTDIGQAMGIAGIQAGQRELNDAEYARLQDRAIGIMEAQTTGQRARGDMISAYNDMGWRGNDAAAALQAARDEGNLREMLGYGQAAASTVGMFGSDERIKTNIRDGGAETRDMLDKLKPKSFGYKPGVGEPLDQRVGIMAQDLEKSEMGRNAVVEAPYGKAIDMKHGIGLALAGLADVHRRLASVERK